MFFLDVCEKIASFRQKKTGFCFTASRCSTTRTDLAAFLSGLLLGGGGRRAGRRRRGCYGAVNAVDEANDLLDLLVVQQCRRQRRRRGVIGGGVRGLGRRRAVGTATTGLRLVLPLFLQHIGMARCKHASPSAIH